MPHLINPGSGYAIRAPTIGWPPTIIPIRCRAPGRAAIEPRRIRQQIEMPSPGSISAIINGCNSTFAPLRQAAAVPPLLATLRARTDARVGVCAVALLADWDFHVRSESVAASIFNVFFPTLVLRGRRRAVRRVGRRVGGCQAAGGFGWVKSLTGQTRIGWFCRRERRQVMRAAFHAALDELSRRLGPDIGAWQWGRFTGWSEKHFLSSRAETWADCSIAAAWRGHRRRPDCLRQCGRCRLCRLPGTRLSPACRSGRSGVRTLGHGSRLDLRSSRQPALTTDQSDSWSSGQYHRLVAGRRRAWRRSTLAAASAAAN